MSRDEILCRLCDEIVLLTRMHIIYGMWDSPQVVAKSALIKKIASDNAIDLDTEIDSTYRVLYHRYVV